MPHHPISDIVSDYPSVIGSVDAAKPGMGGVLFAPAGQPPAMWQATFLEDIQCCIVLTDNNPTGDLTNSNLEQARVLAHADVVTLLFNLREFTLTTLNDNIMAVTRNCKGTITLDQATAYLCHLSSLHFHHYCYYHEVSHIKGTANAMADILSW